MKHFACNSMEEARFRVDVTVDERALHEVYLPHFRRVAGEGVASVMSAYNSVNGDWCGENSVLLTDVLRGEWGWDGFVTSDFIAGLHDPVLSVTAGLEIEMPFRQQRAQHLPEALASGALDPGDIDARVETTVATLLRFADVFVTAPDPSVLCAPDHRALAREAAAASMVLLADPAGLLPVAPGVGRVAVLGYLAAVANLGDGGSSEVLPPEVSTLLDGVRSAFPSADVVHDDSDASIAAGADLAVVVVGCTRADEGEFIDVGTSESMASMFPPAPAPPPVAAVRAPPADDRAEAPASRDAAPSATFAPGGDRRTLRLSPADEALVRATAAACDRTVVAVMGGSAVVMPWLDEVGATLQVWYPGMEGGAAFGDVLTGAREPGGRLPFALPHDEADLADWDPDADSVVYDLFHGQWKLDRDGVAPHRPFGAGLGYTTFDVDPESLHLRAGDAGSTGGSLDVSVANTGERAGSTVLFAFAGLPGSAVDRPVRRLVAFRRVALEAGGRSTVSLPFDLAALAVRQDGRWHQEPGRYLLEVGTDAGRPLASVAVELPPAG